MNYFSFRMKSYLTFLSLFFVLLPLFSIGELSGTDIRSLSLGSVYALSKEWINPAYLSYHTHLKTCISGYNRFGMSELNSSELSAIIPNRLLDAGAKLSRFGSEDYHLLKWDVGMSKKITPHFSIGSRFSYLSRTTVYDENESSGISADLGLFFNLSEKFDLGFLAQNVLSNFPESRQSFHGGFEYRVIPPCRILLESQWLNKEFINVSLGFEFQLDKRLFARAGLRANPMLPSLGVAYVYQSFTFDVSFLMHSNLGGSSGISITYQFERKK